jgi:thioredoxin reductase
VTQHQVLIIGAGPAGLSAAAQLASLGVDDVVVVEREQQAGGVPRHCGHIGFGWREYARLLTGPGYAKRLVAAARRVQMHTGVSVLSVEPGGVVQLTTSNGPATLKGQRILLALGTRESSRAARLVSGSRPWGVVSTGALQQMVYLAGLRPFERAVIVGSELVSFSNLLTMRHAGIKALALLEEGPRIISPGPARAIARLMFGARVLTGTRLVAVRGGARVSGVEVERDGQREVLDCDGLVFSGRFVPESAILQSSHLALDPATGGPVVDQYGRCSDPIYFAAGNLLRPVEASWTAWEEGRAVARAIAASLRRELPGAERFVSIHGEGAVRYVCPQRIAQPAPLPAALPINLRVSHEVHGRLRLIGSGREVWGAQRHLLPERRILIPAPLHLPAEIDSLAVEVDALSARTSRVASH